VLFHYFDTLVSEKPLPRVFEQVAPWPRLAWNVVAHHSEIILLSGSLLSFRLSLRILRIFLPNASSIQRIFFDIALPITFLTLPCENDKFIQKMSSKKNIFKTLKKSLSPRSEIIFCYVHGSFLDSLPFRDIDIALYVDSEQIVSQQTFDYSFDLSLQLSKQTGFEIDVQVMNYSPLGFQQSVLRNGKLLFSKDENLRLNLIESISLEYIAFFELNKQYIRHLVS
jgi:predicted nucleotidyltransferase